MNQEGHLGMGWGTVQLNGRGRMQNIHAPAGPPFSEMKIFFAGDGVITLLVESIDLMLQDIGEPWNVKYTPIHKI